MDQDIERDVERWLQHSPVAFFSLVLLGGLVGMVWFCWWFEAHLLPQLASQYHDHPPPITRDAIAPTNESYAPVPIHEDNWMCALIDTFALGHGTDEPPAGVDAGVHQCVGMRHM